MTVTSQLPPDTPPQDPPVRALPFGEFVALLALMMATVAFSIDAMLPVLSVIGAELSANDTGRVQLVVTVFMLGLGFGTFVAGPISDRFGRKPVILGGIGLYMVAAAVAAVSDSIEALLVARFVQGLGTSAPRVVTQALVRDLYAGRQMAQVVSFAMAIFVLVPAVAPLMGAQINALLGWRAIFWTFLIFGLVSGGWLLLRQPETLPKSRRRALAPAELGAALMEIARNARVMLALIALTLTLAPLLGWIASIALVFEVTFDRAGEFPFWFALVAVLSAPASLINAKLVMRVGMRRLVIVALGAQITVAGLMLVLLALDLPPAAAFATFLGFMLVQFFGIGLLIGNLNALALEPLGHIAGTGASVLGGVSTVFAAIIGSVIAAAFDGTPLPLTLGTLLCALGALVCTLLTQRGD